MPPKFKRDYNARTDQAERQALLEGVSDEEDFFLNGPSAQPSRLLRDGKVDRLQGQVHEVVGVMQDNIGKVLDRGERLEDLQDKSDSLSSSADRFRVQSRVLRQRMWWKECKMRIVIAVVILVVFAIILVPIILHIKNN